MQTPRTGNQTLRTGLLFGAIIGAVGIANSFIQLALGAYTPVAGSNNGITSVALQESGGAALLGCADVLLIFALTMVAGIRAARQTGRVGSGTIAGLIAGAIGALIGSLGGVIIVFTTVIPNFQLPADSTLTQGEMQALLIGSVIFGAVFGVLIDGGIGAGLGALGGLIGVNNYRKANPVTLYNPSMYYPQYPGTPPYPGALPYSGAPGYPPPPNYPTYPGAPQQAPNLYPPAPEQPPFGAPPVGQ